LTVNQAEESYGFVDDIPTFKEGLEGQLGPPRLRCAQYMAKATIRSSLPYRLYGRLVGLVRAEARRG
jgi:hypothetical protein